MTNSRKHIAILGAAVLAASTLAAGSAQAFSFTVFVLKTSTSPERKMCTGIIAAGPAQAVRACLVQFGVDMPNWAYDNQCRVYRSSHRTVHADGTTPQWEYWIPAKPPYENRC